MESDNLSNWVVWSKQLYQRDSSRDRRKKGVGVTARCFRCYYRTTAKCNARVYMTNDLTSFAEQPVKFDDHSRRHPLKNVSTAETFQKRKYCWGKKLLRFGKRCL